MAIVTKEQLMEKIRLKLGESTDDDTLSLIEDINDTVDDYDSRIRESGDWKSKYEENDASWRRKYRDRFFSGEDTADNHQDPLLPTDEPEEVLTYENLFS